MPGCRSRRSWPRTPSTPAWRRSSRRPTGCGRSPARVWTGRTWCSCGATEWRGPDPRAALRPDLVVRDFQPDADSLDARGHGDITYIATEEGRLHLATVIDIASRRVVGWATADHLRTDLVADALTAACRQHRPTGPVIFHSDRGCQYTSRQFAALADQLGVRLPVGSTGQCWDKALAESFFATIKRELLHTTAWPGRAAARTAIFDFIESPPCTVCTAASAIAVPPNTRPHSQPDHHTNGVRQSGTSSLRGEAGGRGRAVRPTRQPNSRERGNRSCPLHASRPGQAGQRGQARCLPMGASGAEPS
ncbi:DDE-type integrase/transposase/recombinase [Streptomyces bobili]|uniref:DDE-type integrase/transposase/recombinase n=1 Tax=Streptomyces bobili TaxID=67280 RepID=UPI00341F687D